MDDIFTYCIGLPDRVDEIVMPCADGYTVYINEKLDQCAKLKAYNHAVSHINNNDWNGTDVQVIERVCHEN